MGVTAKQKKKRGRRDGWHRARVRCNTNRTEEKTPKNTTWQRKKLPLDPVLARNARRLAAPCIDDLESTEEVASFCNNRGMNQSLITDIQSKWLNGEFIPWQQVDNRTIERQHRIPQCLQGRPDPLNFWDINFFPTLKVAQRT